MKKNDEFCHHPELLPTQWEQKRPEPAQMVGCDCGMNMTCSVCGWGRGAIPCKCTPNNQGDYTTTFSPARVDFNTKERP